MKIHETPLSGLKIVELDVYGDSRGFFVERFSAKKFAEAGLPVDYPQDNHSRSAAGVIRGLHFQPNPAQGKMVGCLNGRIWDVAVDVRPESETFGKYFGLELSDENGRLLWIPPGFAHGFCVLGDKTADVLYKITSMYNPDSEQGIDWNDAEIGIQWPFSDMYLEGGEPTISERDKKQPSLADYKQNPAEWV